MTNKIKVKTNPNGANQFYEDPRQKLFWDLYNNPNSETFSNAYQSAQKVGYTEGTSAQITTEKWFLDKLRRSQLIDKAEEVLQKTLSIKINEKKPKHNILRIQVDAAKHVTKTLGKDLGYSDRTELTGKDGVELPRPIIAIDREDIEIKKVNEN